MATMASEFWIVDRLKSFLNIEKNITQLFEAFQRPPQLFVDYVLHKG